MSVVALASAKGSPGVTTTALALASWWPRQAVLIEADPAGGDLAARTGLAEEPGLVGLAAALRRDRPDAPLSGDLLERYQQRSPIGVEVVAAPASSRQARAAVSLLSAQAARSSPAGGDLLMDLGRLAGNSHSGAAPASHKMGGTADLVVWVCRPELADLAHIAGVLGPEHPMRTDAVGTDAVGTDAVGTDAVGTNAGETETVIVLCGEGPYPANEVSATLGRPVLGSLPADNAGAAALWAGGARSWAHSALGRSTRDLVEALVARLPDNSEAQAVGAPEASSGHPGGDGPHEPVLTQVSEDEPIGARQ